MSPEILFKFFERSSKGLDIYLNVFLKLSVYLSFDRLWSMRNWIMAQSMRWEIMKNMRSMRSMKIAMDQQPELEMTFGIDRSFIFCAWCPSARSPKPKWHNSSYSLFTSLPFLTYSSISPLLPHTVLCSVLQASAEPQKGEKGEPAMFLEVWFHVCQKKNDF